MIDIFKDTFKTLFSRLTMSILAIASIAAILAGPFGTFDSMSWGERLVFWPLIVSSSIVLGYAAHAISRCFFGYAETLSSRIFTGLLGTFLVATDVYVIKRLLHAGEMTPYPVFLGWVGVVFYLVIAARSLFKSEVAKTHATEDQAAATGQADRIRQVPRIVRHLPEAERSAVVRISANDHFVHIVTNALEYPVRMRLRDAIAETDGVEGVLVHRSHWVAVEAIVSMEKDAGKHFVRLTNGDRVPVSRSYRSNVEDLGISVASDGAEEQSSASAR